MLRPDCDKRLAEMGISELTCQKCIEELYPDLDLNACLGCRLNPLMVGNVCLMIKGNSKNITLKVHKFIRHQKDRISMSLYCITWRDKNKSHTLVGDGVAVLAINFLLKSEPPGRFHSVRIINAATGKEVSADNDLASKEI